MSIFEKVLEIYHEFYICFHCLGRMFSLLGTDTTNFDRGKSLLLAMTMENHRAYLSKHENHEDAIANLKTLAEKAIFNPAQSVLEREGIEYDKTTSNNIQTFEFLRTDLSQHSVCLLF